MRFELRAITPDGRIESLDYQAVDEQSARQQAENRGYTVLQVRSRHTLSLLRATRFPVQLFTQELLVLLNAGLPKSRETIPQCASAAGDRRPDRERGTRNAAP